MISESPHGEIALPAVVEIIDELAALLVHQNIAIEDAVSLLKGAYIDAVRQEYPTESVAQLCSSQDGDPPRLPMSRNTVFSQTSKARTLRRLSLARRIEQYTRHMLFASTKDPKTRDDVRSELLSMSAFSSLKRSWFNEVFEEVFDQMIERGALAPLEQSPECWRCTEQHRHRTTEDELDADSKRENAELERDMAYSAQMARRVTRQMRDILERRMFIPHQKHIPRLPNAGLQTFSMSIRNEDIQKLDQFFIRTISPFLEALTEHADIIKTHAFTNDPDDPNYVSLCYITWMWSPEIQR